MKLIKLTALVLIAFSTLMISNIAIADENQNSKLALAKKVADDTTNIDSFYSLFGNMVMSDIENRIKNNPQTSEYQEQILRACTKAIKESFYDKKMIEALNSMFAEIYAEEFTEDELKALLAFYNSPVGQKSVQKQAVLFNKSAERAEQLFANLFTPIFNEKFEQNLKNMPAK